MTPAAQLAAVPDSALVADGLMTIAEACTYLGFKSSTTIYTLMDHQGLPYVIVGAHRRIPKRALVEYLAARLVRRDRAVS